ncbi:enoyl-CoA hydratase/isomerase [Caulobacter sp. BK020]|uniref:enoyl-CoA hydratase/isomerase n=1 Tax=Caulobacter sp. BK020 TaxID=2512117 RepID=UPI00104FAF41|nr:enoyl-CoA hydratase/isomerase [Caulobacter sp. BK020]TCS17438.1 enoyl-CoA hydratase [Caulobacter sp. BK020]
MTYGKIRLEAADGVAVITLADPATLNAAGLDMARELAHALCAIAAGEVEARAVILTGEGRGFCSGANLAGGPAGREMDTDDKPDVGAALESTYNPLIDLLRDFPAPIVTAVNGAAAGIGCSLALLGDIVVAAESAYFLQAFRRIGLVPDGGSTYLLPRLVGKARAMEMMLLGDKVSAPTALSWGLINRCVPDAELMTTASAIARDLADGPAALSIIRKLVWDSLDADWGTQLQAERQGQKAAGKTDDFIEGVSAFLQKRPAAFRGR